MEKSATSHTEILSETPTTKVEVTAIDTAEAFLDTANRKKTEKNKRGFRIDDILFSVTNSVDKNYKHRATREIPSPSTPTSVKSVVTIDAAEINPPSPVSFVKRHQASRSCSDSYVETSRNTHGDEEMYAESLSPIFHDIKETTEQDIFNQQMNDSKKPRTSFTPDQIQTLEDSFNEKHYLNHTERTMLADELNLTDCQIKTWFQNRRMKMKRQYKEAVEKGHLIPYHPYPFPRYSRLTPAHFASVPALNSRNTMSKNNNSTFFHQRERTTPSCTCCTPSNQLYPESPYNKHIRTMRYSGDYSTERLHSPPEVLTRRRDIERRDLRSLRDYYHQVRKDGNKSYS